MVPIGNNGDTRAAVDDLETLGALEYFSTGALSLLASVLWLVVFYEAVLAMARPLYVLSTTAVLIAFLAIWAALWLALELAWAWRRDRLSTA